MLLYGANSDARASAQILMVRAPQPKVLALLLFFYWHKGTDTDATPQLSLLLLALLHHCTSKARSSTLSTCCPNDLVPMSPTIPIATPICNLYRVASVIVPLYHYM